MKSSNPTGTSPDTTVIFLNNKLGSGNKQETTFLENQSKQKDEKSDDPVNQVYLIGGNNDKRNYASGKD